MPLGKPPPLPPRHVSQTVTLAQLLDGARPVQESIPDDEPTQPQGVDIRPEILVKYWSACAPEDQDYLLRLAEGYAARNVKT